MRRSWSFWFAVLLVVLLPFSALAQEKYKVTLTYEDGFMTDYEKEYAEGETVILEPYIGVVRKAEKNHIGLDHWEEQSIPAGSPAVELKYEPHPTSVNLQICSFVMPARDVVLKAYLAERYVVVYKLFEDTKKKVQYHCRPGDKLPAYSLNGSVPIREGYVFDGWSPEPGEKLTGSTTYIAKWKPWDPVEVNPVGDSMKIRIDMDVKAFDPYNLQDASGYKLELGRDFTYREGSTIIKLTKEYLEKQSNGENIEITANFVTIDEESQIEDSCSIKVIVQNASGDVDLPKTGDSSSLFAWLCMLGAALALFRRRAAC